MTEHDFILEETVDGKGWVISDRSGTLMISWDKGYFITSFRIVAPEKTNDELTKEHHHKIMMRMASWLTKFHSSKIY